MGPSFGKFRMQAVPKAWLAGGWHIRSEFSGTRNFAQNSVFGIMHACCRDPTGLRTTLPSLSFPSSFTFDASYSGCGRASGIGTHPGPQRCWERPSEQHHTARRLVCRCRRQTDLYCATEARNKRPPAIRNPRGCQTITRVAARDLAWPWRRLVGDRRLRRLDAGPE